MNTRAVMVAVLPTVMIMGAILAPVLSRRRSAPVHGGSSPQDDGSEDAGADKERVRPQVNESGLDGGHDQRIDSDQEDQYYEDWMTLQERYVD